MEDAEGQLQELAAPHADGVAAGIIAAAQQAAADLAQLPALVRGGSLPGEWHAVPCLLHPEFCIMQRAKDSGRISSPPYSMPRQTSPALGRCGDEPRPELVALSMMPALVRGLLGIPSVSGPACTDVNVVARVWSPPVSHTPDSC